MCCFRDGQHGPVSSQSRSTMKSTRWTYSSASEGETVRTAHRFDNSSHFWSSFLVLLQESLSVSVCCRSSLLHCCINLLGLVLLLLWLSLFPQTLRYVLFIEACFRDKTVMQVGGAGGDGMKFELNSL